MQKDLSAVVLDPRLSPAAARLVLDVARRGSGEHEIPFSHFKSLTCAGEKVTRSALKLAEERRWISRRPGGQGKHDCFEFTPAESATLIATESGITPAESATLTVDASENYPGQKSTPNDITPANNAALSSRARVSPVRAVSEEASKLDSEPPVVPLSAEAEKFLDEQSEKFNGCRGALRDYLQERVHPRRQSAYLHSLACYIDDSQVVFRWPDGGRVPIERRTPIVSTALNELRAHGERDVQPPMKPMKWPNGDVRNLKTKISILIKQEWEHGKRKPDTNGRGAPRKGEGEEGGAGDYDHLG